MFADCFCMTEAPQPPTKLEVRDQTSRSAALEFTPGDDGKAPITSFTVQTRSDGQGVWTTLTTKPAKQGSQTR